MVSVRTLNLFHGFNRLGNLLHGFNGFGLLLPVFFQLLLSLSFFLCFSSICLAISHRIYKQTVKRLNKNAFQLKVKAPRLPISPGRGEGKWTTLNRSMWLGGREVPKWTSSPRSICEVTWRPRVDRQTVNTNWTHYFPANYGRKPVRDSNEFS